MCRQWHLPPLTYEHFLHAFMPFWTVVQDPVDKHSSMYGNVRSHSQLFVGNIVYCHVIMWVNSGASWTSSAAGWGLGSAPPLPPAPGGLLEPDGAQQKTIPNRANSAKCSGYKAEKSPSRSDSRLSSCPCACACQLLNGSSGISTEHRTLGACIAASCSWAVAHGNALLSTPCSARTHLFVYCLSLSFFHSCIPFTHSFIHSFLPSIIYFFRHSFILPLLCVLSEGNSVSSVTCKVLYCNLAGKHNQNGCLCASTMLQSWHADVVSGLVEYSDDRSSWRGLAVVSPPRLRYIGHTIACLAAASTITWAQLVQKHMHGSYHFRIHLERHYSPSQLDVAPSKLMAAGT